jgi:hypothetical protein
MSDTPLSSSDWQELTTLIVEAPPDRIRVAVNRVSASAVLFAREDPGRLLTGVDWLLHLAEISSGYAFERALLRELRRLRLQ